MRRRLLDLAVWLLAVAIVAGAIALGLALPEWISEPF